MDELFTSRSRLEVEKQRFDWNMRGLSEMKMKNERAILVNFRFNSGEKMFKLVSSFMGDSLQDSELNIKMKNVKAFRQIELMKLKVSILDRDQKVVRWTETRRVFIPTNAHENWTLPVLMTRKELLETNSPLMCGDVLYLLFEFTILCKDIVNVIDRTLIATGDTEPDNVSNISNSSEVSIQFEELPPLQSPSDDVNGRRESLDILSKDLHSMYLERKFTDFVLRSEDVEYSVHKNILYSRSEFFRNIFFRARIRPCLSSWTVTDVDKYTLNRMIIFLYTGSMGPDLLWEDVVQLYKAAHIYRVSSLQRQCSVVLRSRISSVKVIEALIMADRYDDKELKSVASEFVLSHFDEITMSEQWKRFVKVQPLLAAKLLDQLNKDRIQNNMTKEVTGRETTGL